MLSQAYANIEDSGNAAPTGLNDWINFYGADYYNNYRLYGGMAFAFGFSGGALLGNSLISPRAFSHQSTISPDIVYGYYGMQGGSVKYVGISNNPNVRFGVHSRSGSGKEHLNFGVQNRFSSRLRARIWEQSQINKIGLKNLLNQRNEIRPSLWQQYNISP